MTKAFILGNPRSGTSLLRLMLNSHRSIAAPPECGFLQWWHGKYKSWTAEEGRSENAIAGFVSDLVTSRKFETWSLDKDQLIRFLAQRQPVSYSELGLWIYIFWGMQRGKIPEAVVDKNNYYIRHLEELYSIWPDARFIHLVRDGRDVACSYMDVARLNSQSPYKPVLPVHLDEIAREWHDNNRNIDTFLGAIPVAQCTRVRYEDLVTNTEKVLRDLVNLLGVPFDERMLKYYEYNDEPSSTLDWKRKTLERPDPRTIGRYRNILGNEEVKRFDEIAADMLFRFGYGVSEV